MIRQSIILTKKKGLLVMKIKSVIYPSVTSEEVLGAINTNLKAAEAKLDAMSSDFDEYEMLDCRVSATDNRFNVGIGTAVIGPVVALVVWIVSVLFMSSGRPPAEEIFTFTPGTPFFVLSVICGIIAAVAIVAGIILAIYNHTQFNQSKQALRDAHCNLITKVAESIGLKEHERWVDDELAYYFDEGLERVKEILRREKYSLNPKTDWSLKYYVGSLKALEDLPAESSLRLTSSSSGMMEFAVEVNGLFIKNCKIYYAAESESEKTVFDRAAKITAKLESDGVLDLSVLDECVKPYLSFKV